MKIICLICILSVTSSFSANLDDPEGKLLLEVKNWAGKLGREFWEFGIFVTRRKQVQESYKSAEIDLKDGAILTKEIASKIETMMDQKVAAVQRIMDYAGNAASDIEVDESFDYYNVKNLTNNLTLHEEEEKSKKEEENTEEPVMEEIKRVRRFFDDGYQDDEGFDDEVSMDFDENKPQIGEAKKIPKVTDGSEDAQASQQEVPKINYRVLNLTENPNFFDIPVNTDHSAVHVPANVYDRAQEVISGIKWSENLDNIFKSNYLDDPTLSWQYFGSSTGFMRQYPAMIWKSEPVDMYDCRMRAWFIEAASSPKDIVVLVDKSGSMTGMRKEIAKHVVNNILETLGNNDYVNIFLFSNVTEPLVDCFNETLVQANLGNVRAFKEEMEYGEKFKTENIANFSNAFITAFQLLENYRIGSRNKSGAGCNQAIMLITDGVQYNYKEIFEQYNWYMKNNNTFVHVRIFTYLIGREVSDVREVKWMACANQGYYVHLSTFAEVREQVLLYIPVMARPMVLEGEKPIPTWSSVYADVTDPKLTNWLWTQIQRREQRELLTKKHHKKRHDFYGDLLNYELMTSVSMPVYDRRQNASRVANLLGVAGTDVPVHYIQQLMMPHLLGVNAYAFIITNNGYILIHPDLRPVFDGILKPAYNRVDMAEVELPDDDLDPRIFNGSLLAMRKEVVRQKNGRRTMDMKYHMDDMKRLMRGRRHYFYQALNNTPFTLVVTIPDKYGNAKLKPPVNDEIHRLNANNKNFTEFFNSTKWKIHPDWIYCRYLAIHKKKFNSSEAELKDFLERMEREHWKWSIPKPPPTYECDRELMQSLVYDARVTKWFDKTLMSQKGEDRHKLIQTFGITVAFLATHSGLTRWQDFDYDPNKTHFSKVHNRAIDEIWYKRAVEQHYVEENSFVYSVPFDAGDDDDALVTASHAIFLDKNGRKTPVAVVGYQFKRKKFLAKFENITSRCTQNDSLACYVLDNNGYVVLSFNEKDTGKWFGHIKENGMGKKIMELLVAERVYNPVRMYDYQGVCFPRLSPEEHSFGNINLTPLNYLFKFLHWTITMVLYFLDLVSADMDQSELSEPTFSPHPLKSPNEQIDPKYIVNKTKPTACDQERYLYELVHYTTGENPFNSKMSENCSRPFIAQKVPFSNLILLVVRSACKLDKDSNDNFHEEMSPDAIEVDYNMSLACRIRADDLPRKRYGKCIRQHDNETQIQLCGRSSTLTIPSVVTIFIISVLARL